MLSSKKHLKMLSEIGIIADTYLTILEKLYREYDPEETQLYYNKILRLKNKLEKQYETTIALYDEIREAQLGRNV